MSKRIIREGAWWMLMFITFLFTYQIANIVTSVYGDYPLDIDYCDDVTVRAEYYGKSTQRE